MLRILQLLIPDGKPSQLKLTKHISKIAYSCLKTLICFTLAARSKSGAPFAFPKAASPPSKKH
jgi:hypothetical protein